MTVTLLLLFPILFLPLGVLLFWATGLCRVGPAVGGGAFIAATVTVSGRRLMLPVHTHAGSHIWGGTGDSSEIRGGRFWFHGFGCSLFSLLFRVVLNLLVRWGS